MSISLSIAFQIISFLTSLVLFYRKRNKLILIFIPFLFLTVSVELTGNWYFSKGIKNYQIYNIFTTIEFIFYSFLFYSHLKKPFFKKSVLLFVLFFLICFTINVLFIQGFNKTFNTYTFLLGSFFLVIFCCCFFYESVLPDRIDLQLAKQPFFWVCTGLLIFYLGSVIINALFEYLRSNDLQEQGKKIYQLINRTLNVILYSTFCIAFFLCRDNRKISS